MLGSCLMNKTLRVALLSTVLVMSSTKVILAQQQVKFTDVPALKELISSKKPILNIEGDKVLKLTIEDCLKSALKHNYDIRIQAYRPALVMDEIIQAEAAFDAILVGSASIDHMDENDIDATYYRKYDSDNGDVSSEKIRTNAFERYYNSQYALGLRKRLSTGADIQITESMRKSDDLFRDSSTYYYTPFIEYGLELQLTQPLLRNFGVDVNRASIRAAYSRMNMSKQDFYIQVVDTMTNVEGNYWQLFFYRQYVKILTQLLERSENTLERVKARSSYDGKSLSITRTLSVIETTRADLLQATNQTLQLQKALLQSINNPEWPITSQCEIITIDSPQRKHYDISYEQAVENALELRPELIKQKYYLEISDLSVAIAENQALPRVDLTVTHKITGADFRNDDAIERQFDNKTYNWGVGLSMEYPIANRAAKASLSNARKQKEMQELALKSLQEQVLYDVSNSLNELHHKYSEIESREQSVIAARNELLNYLAIQDTDRKDSTSPEFLNLKLNADDRLSRNQIAAVRAMVGYDLAVMHAHRAQGVLDRYNNVEIEME